MRLKLSLRHTDNTRGNTCSMTPQVRLSHHGQVFSWAIVVTALEL
jgi:hypothetical protein